MRFKRLSVFQERKRQEKTDMEEMLTTYDPKQFEEKIYREWTQQGCFRAQIDKNKVPFTVMMPPPGTAPYGARHGRDHAGYPYPL